MTHPRLLVSVRDSEEASAARDGGVDLIDIKEPAHGPLGMAERGTMEHIVRTVDSARPISVALGELHEFATMRIPEGVQYAKIGLANAPPDWRGRLVEAFQATHVKYPIATAYADYPRVAAPAVDQVLDWALQNRAAGLLIDTAVKDGRILFDWLTDEQLSQIVRRAHRGGLLVAVAGSLRIEAMPRCCQVGPDLIAVRGAACRQSDRSDRVSLARVRELVQVIATHSVGADSHEDRPARSAPNLAMFG